MKLSSLLSNQMHRACRYKLGILIAAAALLCCTGCRKNIDTISLGEWIQELDEQSGISAYTQKEPYYPNVSSDNAYYSAVQAAVEWQVLDPSDAFEPETPLTKEWAAMTLMNLTGEDTEGTAVINDLRTSAFPEEIKKAVDSGLMETDAERNFHPRQIMERDEAEHLLAKAVLSINHRIFENKEPEIEWKEADSTIEETPITFDERTLTGSFSSEKQFKKNDILHWHLNNKDYCYAVDEVNNDQDRQNVQCRKISLDEDTDALKVQGSEDLDFSKALMQTDSHQIIQQSAAFVHSDPYLTSMKQNRLQKEFSIGDFNVVLETSGSSILAKASRTMSYGTVISAAAVLNHVHINYAWDSKKYDLKNAYFKIEFDSEEDLSVKNEKGKTLYGDFSKIDSSDFLPSLKNLYQTKNDAQETTLKLCQLTVPLPNAPVLNITMNLELRLSTTGKAELILTQENGIGFETRNGVMRLIKENTGKADATVQATTKILAGIRFGLGLLNGTLMDAGVDAGAEGVVKATIHLYDSQGEMTSVSTDLPGDAAENCAEGNDNVLVCTDVNAHWVLNASVNSSASLAGKFGISKEFELLGEDNAPLIPGLNHHFENGHAVDQCTRKSRRFLPTADGITAAKHICLKKYSFAVKTGSISQIEIEALPDGYTADDLVYESSNTDAADVDQAGCIHGRNQGSAVITVKTKDGKHTIHCNVIVPAE